MTENYVTQVSDTFYPDPTEPIMESIFQQYEKVLIESLITSFGLDFLLKDQHGGDVDTIHNVRQIGTDEKMNYKNRDSQQAYDNRGEYISKEYHKSNHTYCKIKDELNRQKKEGKALNGYTGEKLAPNAKADTEHIISAKEIHDDSGRVLAGIDGTALANTRENLVLIDPSTNRSKQAKTMTEYIEVWKETQPERRAEIKRLEAKPELTDTERKKLQSLKDKEAFDPQKAKEADIAARKSYDAKIARAYYTSPKFAKSMALAAGNVGVRMGARQALGFVFAEMWFAVKAEFQRVSQRKFDLGEFLKALGQGIKRGFERAKEKYADIFSRFLSGTAAGVLSSLTTTLCNIFFTTAKNVVRIVRQSWASLVEAGKVLFINPDNYTFGERMKAVVKILATGASVVVGTLVSEAVSKTPINLLPGLGNAVQSFCGAFVTGIMSCTFLYFFDRSEKMQALFKTLDGLHTIETEINYYRQQADYFERYAAKLEGIDLAQFQKETTFYNNAANRLASAKTESELNRVLKQTLQEIGTIIPWQGHDSFNSFMQSKNARLVFE